MSRSTFNLVVYGLVLTMLVTVIDANLALHHLDQAISMAVWATLMFNMGRTVGESKHSREPAVEAGSR